MEEKKEAAGLLDMIPRPVFLVNDQIVTATNSAAAALMVLPDTPVRELIRLGADAYEELEEGCVCLTLQLGGRDHSASVTRRPEGDLFLLEQEEDTGEFRALALAAQDMRPMLSNALNQAEALLSILPEDRKTTGASLNRSLYQLLRRLGNMTDTSRLSTSFHPETRNLTALFQEFLEKAGVLAEHKGITLTYQPLPELVLGLVDTCQLERAVFNILSNALKFTPPGGQVQASLTRSGRTLRFTVTDSGSGMDREILDTLFYRALRHPSVEDSRCGMGLGMVLIRTVAANHGGAVLVDRTRDGGTRITMTLSIRQSSDTSLRCPDFCPDYTGERDHCLVELSDCLPSSLYDGSF